MKKLAMTLMLFTLAGCSSKNDKLANDTYTKQEYEGHFATLQTGGVNLPPQDMTFHIPQSKIIKGEAMDIRPPVLPMAIISDSTAQFDGQRASIVYDAQKKNVYNLQQIQRLLSEQGITFSVQGNRIQTEWTTITNSGSEKDIKVRYEIQEIGNTEANALTVAILEMKRDDVVFTPTLAEKQRYSSQRLNQWIGELNATYQMQLNQLGK
ncbi:MAG: outer membrane protein assembly factor BamC [Lonepinella koalarum]|nr:outer membrane protein assembly factor BamC [Lonepinella koalarum]